MAPFRGRHTHNFSRGREGYDNLMWQVWRERWRRIAREEAEFPMNEPPRILLDMGIGADVDDALALTLAARSPEIYLIGVTTNHGAATLGARIAP